MEGAVLDFPQKILEIGFSLDFVKKKNNSKFFFSIGGGQHFKELSDAVL